MRGVDSKDSEDFIYKYNLSLNEFIISSDLWDEILNLNIIDKDKIEKELYDAYFRFKEEQPTWLKLMNFLDLEELTFNELIKVAKEEVENHQLKHPSDILHTISMLIYFKENQFISFSLDHLLPIAITNWKESIEVNERMREIRDFSFTEYSGSYGFYAKGVKKFDEFMKEIVKAYKDKYNERNLERVSDLFYLIENNSDLFYQRIALTNNAENYYYNYPILKSINPVEFANKICTIKKSATLMILHALKERYCMKLSPSIYSEEKEWFEFVLQEFQGNNFQIESNLIKFKINKIILPELLDIKLNAFEE